MSKLAPVSYSTRRVGPLRVQPRTRWLAVAVVPWLVPLLGSLFVGPAYLSGWSSFGGGTLVVFVAVAAWFWLLDRATGAIVQRWPGLHHTWQRVLLSALACDLMVVLLFGFLASFFIALHPFGSTLTLHQLRAQNGVLPEMQRWLSHQLGLPISRRVLAAAVYLLDAVVILLLASVYEAFYLLDKWKESKFNYEQLRQAGLQSQLQSLRGQVNPHFLFNTLNSLSSLIAESPAQAEQFVDEIAKVYRYLLQTGEGVLTPLATELAFIESYFHLLKTRHGAGLELRIRVAEAYLRHQLPPLTLQMLVENAVKHNVILAARPLRIDIETTPAGELAVRNNCQPKTTRLDSTRVGLSNIRARYQLLAQANPVVEATASQFTVTLPLLAPASSTLPA